MKRKSFLLILLILSVLLIFPQSSAQTIEPNSAVKIEIKGVPEGDSASIGGVYKLDPDGTIQLPYLNGSIRAKGLTARALANSLTSAYKAAKIYTSPLFIVQIDSADNELRSQYFIIGGKVGSPGKKPVTPQMTLYEAILAAGGITDFGSPKITLRRDGKTETIDYNIEANRMRRIKNGDMIHVRERGVLEGGVR